MGHPAWGPPPGCSEAEERRLEQEGEPRTVSRDAVPQTSWGSGMLGAGAMDASAGPQAPQQPARRFAPFGGEGRRLGGEDGGGEGS